MYILNKVLFLSLFVGFSLVASAEEMGTIHAKTCQFNDGFQYKELVGGSKLSGKLTDKVGFQGAKTALEILAQKGYSVKPIERSALQEDETYSDVEILCNAVAQYSNGQFRYECATSVNLYKAAKNVKVYTLMKTVLKPRTAFEMKSYELDPMWNSVADLVKRLPSCKVTE